MIDFLKQNKLMIVGALVLLVAAFVYFSFFSGSAVPVLTSSDTQTTVSKDLLVTLQSLHTIQLNNAIFTDPAFLSLDDFGVTIPPENVGRRNPFQPLGGGTPATPGSAPAGASITIPPTQ